MEKMYPLVVKDGDVELTFEPCHARDCDEEAMMEHQGHGYCGAHYAEAEGWGQALTKPENVITIPEPDHAAV
jgi:hypothetical protein